MTKPTIKEIPEDTETYGFEDYFKTEADEELEKAAQYTAQYEKRKKYKQDHQFLWDNGCYKNNIDKEWHTRNGKHFLGRTVTEAAKKLRTIMKAAMTTRGNTHV